MEEIFLKGGQVQLTDNPKTAYKVISGHVLVYIVPFQYDKPGRRFLVCEAVEGDTIPSLVWNHEQLGSWRFSLVALEKAHMEILAPADLDGVKVDFSKLMGIRLFSPEEFEEQVVEQYNINIIKEEGYIYATSLEQKSTYEKGLKLIFDMFHKKSKKQHTLRAAIRFTIRWPMSVMQWKLILPLLIRLRRAARENLIYLISDVSLILPVERLPLRKTGIKRTVDRLSHIRQKVGSQSPVYQKALQNI